MKITSPKLNENPEQINLKEALQEDYYISNATVCSLEGIEESEGKIIFDQYFSNKLPLWIYIYTK